MAFLPLYSPQRLNTMKLKFRDYIYKCLIFLGSAAFLTIFIYPLYYGGDLEHYNNYYYGVESYNIQNAFKYYNQALGTQEPIYFLITYFAASLGINKLLLITLVNVTISYLIFRLIYSTRPQTPYLFLLIAYFSCFYILVILTSAERLKFGLLFYLIGMNCKSMRMRYFWFSISFFTHVQMSLLIIADFNYYYLTPAIKTGRIRSTVIFLLFTSLIVAFLSAFYLKDHILNKLNAYSSMTDAFQGGVISTTKVLVFLACTFLFSKKNYLGVFLVYLPIIVFSYFLGEERVLIFCYFIFCSFFLQSNQPIKYLIYIPFLLYFGLKGIIFINNIVTYGNGFI